LSASVHLEAAPGRPALEGLTNDDLAGRFVDDVWDLAPLLARRRKGERLSFCGVPAGFRQPVKEFAWLALRTPATVPKAQARLDPATLNAEVGHLRRFTTWLTDVGVTNFGQVTQAHLDDFVLRRRQEIGPGRLRCLVRALQRCAAYSAGFSEPAQRFRTVPWKGRPANVVAGERRRGENTTLRVPEDVMAPVLRVALLYVEQFAQDIVAAQREARALATKDQARRVPRDEQLRLVDQEIGRRRSTGLGVPVRHDGAPDALALLRWAGGYPYKVHEAVQGRAAAALAELGPATSGLTTAPSVLEATGAPWREPFGLGGPSLGWEARRLAWACSIVISYLSGMRPSELVNLRRGCAVVERGADGTPARYKLEGTAYKGRRPEGSPAVWVVLAVVHRAVEVLRCLSDEPDDALLLSALAGSGQLRRFITYANRRFGHVADLRVPDVDGQAWALSFRQMRRTLAWHIRNRPFCHVAGAIQYQHAQVTMFEGYAGTTRSGFAQEVQAEREAANLAELFDLVVGALVGRGLAGQGGALLARRVRAISEEMGGLEGVIAHPERVKSMLKSEAANLHPALLNDCFFDPAVAKCLRGAPDDQRHSPVPNRCEPFRCTNAVISAKHRPLWEDEHARVDELLKAARAMPAAQRVVLMTRKGQIEDVLRTVEGP
jgi:integrase